MKTIKIFGLSIVVLLLFACGKKDPYIIKGRLIYDCGIPVANLDNVELKTDGKEFLTTTSDENGYFSFAVTKGNRGHLRINKDEILSLIPLYGGKEKDLGDVYVGGTIDLIVKLQVNNPHTANDTLFYWDLESNDPTAKIALPGPFTTGVVDTFIDGYFPNFPIFYGKSPRLDFAYYYSNYDGGHYSEIDVSFCDMNEITLVID